MTTAADKLVKDAESAERDRVRRQYTVRDSTVGEYLDPVDRLMADTASLEPGDMQVGDYVRKPEAEGGDTPEVPGMIVADLVSAGYSYLYDTVSREAYLVNNNMVETQLKVKRSDGTVVFTKTKPARGPHRGTIKCFLHADQPERPKYAALGFAACPKATLPNQYQADNHARNKHRDEWKAVEAEREATERREDRAAQQAMFQRLGTILTSEAPPPTVTEAPAPTGPVDPPVTARSGHCTQCAWYSRKRVNREISLQQHVDRVHG